MSRKISEFLLLIFIMVLLQAIEIAILSDTPKFFAPISFLPIFVTYFSLSRNWFLGTFLTLIFALFFSANSALPSLILSSGALVAFFISKSIVAAFTLENRKSFSYLCALIVIIMKVWILGVSSSRGNPIPITWHYFFHFILNPALTFFIGWFFFPFFIKWDEIFEHENNDSRELKPGL